MKIFISWSGTQSKGFATKLADWLPDVIQSVKPFVSVDDVDKGSRWANVVAKELEEASFGIICLTRDSLRSPWLNFEAGALSRRFITADEVPVATLLLDMENPSDVPQPLGQFNATVASRDDVLRLLRTINNAAGGGIDEARLVRHYDIFWPALESVIAVVRDAQPDQAVPDTKPLRTDGKIDEMLSILRQIERSRVVATPAEAHTEHSTELPVSRERLAAEMRVLADGFGVSPPTVLLSKSGPAFAIFNEPLTSEQRVRVRLRALSLGVTDFIVHSSPSVQEKDADD